MAPTVPREKLKLPRSKLMPTTLLDSSALTLRATVVGSHAEVGAKSIHAEPHAVAEVVVLDCIDAINRDHVGSIRTRRFHMAGTRGRSPPTGTPTMIDGMTVKT